LWIEVTGLKNPASWSSIVVVDAFDVAPASPPPVFTSGKRLEETNAAVGYTSGWTQGDRSAAWSGATAAASATPGARATVSFTGTSIEWIGLRGPSAGMARVFVDGVFRADVDLYEPTGLQAVVFSTSGLANGPHTMTIEATGAHNAASTGATVAVDAFDTRARLEESHPAIAYADYWELTVSRAWSDRDALYTWVATAHATVTFQGPSIRWIGYRGPLGGIARLFLDGNFIGMIDSYAAEEAVQAVLYEAAGLAAGSHTLRIEVTGEMHPLSQKPFVAIDAFDLNF
jgi:bacillopeptidase F